MRRGLKLLATALLTLAVVFVSMGATYLATIYGVYAVLDDSEQALVLAIMFATVAGIVSLLGALVYIFDRVGE